MNATAEGSGRLTLVATPIGNLGDISERARMVLAEADVVGCEDSRRTGLLFQRLGLERGRFVVVNDHTEDARIEGLVQAMCGGQHVALVSDAGMPGVSDPGARLVAAAHDAGVVVSVVPGASAVLGALVVSGLPTARFAMEGFLPRRGEARRRRLELIAGDDRTTVLFESPNRLSTTLQDLAAVCGPDRVATVVRELTKLHEQVERGSLGSLAERFSGPVKGEVVVVVGPGPGEAAIADDDDIAAALSELVAAGATKRDAVDEVSSRLGVNRNRVYELAITLGKR